MHSTMQQVLRPYCIRKKYYHLYNFTAEEKLYNEIPIQWSNCNTAVEVDAYSLGTTIQ